MDYSINSTAHCPSQGLLFMFRPRRELSGLSEFDQKSIVEKAP